MPAKFKPNPHLGRDLAGIFAGLIQQGGFVMERETKRRTPVDTGHLRNSWHTDVEVRGTIVHVSVGSNVEYAVYVEFGPSEMEARHMLAHGTAATARWLAARGFNIEYVSEGVR